MKTWRLEFEAVEEYRDGDLVYFNFPGTYELRRFDAETQSWVPVEDPQEADES